MAIFIIAHASHFQVTKTRFIRNAKRRGIYLVRISRVNRVHKNTIINRIKFIPACLRARFHRNFGSGLRHVGTEKHRHVLGDLGCLQHALGTDTHLCRIAERLPCHNYDNTHDGDIHQQFHEGKTRLAGFRHLFETSLVHRFLTYVEHVKKHGMHTQHSVIRKINFFLQNGSNHVIFCIYFKKNVIFTSFSPPPRGPS